MRRLREDRRGQALVEFAIVAILFFLMTFAIMQFSMLHNTRLLIDHASREGARYAATRAFADPDPAVADDMIKDWIIADRAPRLNPPLTKGDIEIVTPDEPDPRESGKRIQVTIRYQVAASLPLIAPLVGNRQIVSSSNMRIE